MYNVSALRTLIKNGWTIANRRAIISKIGKANFDEIINNLFINILLNFKPIELNYINGNFFTNFCPL